MHVCMSWRVRVRLPVRTHARVRMCIACACVRMHVCVGACFTKKSQIAKKAVKRKRTEKKNTN